MNNDTATNLINNGSEMNTTMLISSTTTGASGFSLSSHPVLIIIFTILLILVVIVIIGNVGRQVRMWQRRRAAKKEILMWEAVLREAAYLYDRVDHETLKQQYILISDKCTCKPQVDP